MNKADIASVEYLKRKLRFGEAGQLIDDLRESIRYENDVSVKTGLLIHSAFAKLSLEMIKGAIADCDQAKLLERNLPHAYFVKGLAYLWSASEERALTVWREGITCGGPLNYFSLMERLIVDHNLRAHLFNLRFNVLEVLNMLIDGPKEVYTASDTQQAFAELRVQPQIALNHFDVIIAADPTNIHAYKGRGCAACLLGKWPKAIEDLTKVINAKVDLAESCKFRAIAYTAHGNYAAAVADYSIVIANNPSDYEALYERGRIQMMRKFYSHALADFQKIKDTHDDGSLLVSMAECHYALGNLQVAKEIIEHVPETCCTQRRFYCYYLILRDLRRFNKAMQSLMKAMGKGPTFFLLRTAGDFAFELGRSEEAVGYYTCALNQNPKDAETKKMYARALFQLGEMTAACNALVYMSAVADDHENVIDLYQDTFGNVSLNGELKNFGVDHTGFQVLKEAANDGRFMIHLIHSLNQPVTRAIRELVRGPTRIAKDEVPEQCQLPEIDEPILDVIEDADRLGSKCIVRAFGAIENARVIRALGFCILHLAHQMKTHWFGNPGKSTWVDAFESCRGILNLANLKTDVHWIMDIKTRTVRHQSIPVYYVMKSERISPRIARDTMQLIMNRLRSGFPDSHRAASRELNSMTQFSTIMSWISEDMSISGRSHMSRIHPDDEVEIPSVNARYLGAHGWDVFIKPPTDQGAIHMYHDIMAREWETLMTSDNSSERLSSLAYLIDLIWMLHPFTAYSHEMGHVLFHAFLLATESAETETLQGPTGELFMRRLVQMAREPLDEICKAVYAKKQPTTVHEHSLTFWEKMPTIGTILKCYHIKFEKLDALDDSEPPFTVKEEAAVKPEEEEQDEQEEQEEELHEEEEQEATEE